jgi:hypothetical protein
LRVRAEVVILLLQDDQLVEAADIAAVMAIIFALAI